MGAFSSIGRGAFFRSSRRGVLRRARGPLPAFSWAARDVGERSLVKAEAAGGGGRRPAFTRVRSPTTIAWRDRGAEGMSVCRSFLRPASAARRSASCISNREDCVVVGMRHAAAAAFDVLVLPGAPNKITMDEFESLNHTKWDCKYHVVFIPKYRRKVLYGELERHLGLVFRQLAEQRESRVEEGHLMPDHVHMLLAIPPKYAVSHGSSFGHYSAARKRVPRRGLSGVPGFGSRGSGMPSRYDHRESEITTQPHENAPNHTSDWTMLIPTR